MRSILALVAMAAAFLPGAAGAAVVTGLKGEFFDMSPPVLNLDSVNRRIAEGPADGLFRSTRVDYAIGSGKSFLEFLGGDAGSFQGEKAEESDGWAVRLTGRVRIGEGDERFTVFSDDGFALFLDGQRISAFDGLRPPGSTTVSTLMRSGWLAVEIIMWENRGRAALGFLIDGQTVDASRTLTPVPLPGAMLVFLTGLLGLSAARRRF